MLMADKCAPVSSCTLPFTPRQRDSANRPLNQPASSLFSTHNTTRAQLCLGTLARNGGTWFGHFCACHFRITPNHQCTGKTISPHPNLADNINTLIRQTFHWSNNNNLKNYCGFNKAEHALIYIIYILEIYSVVIFVKGFWRISNSGHKLDEHSGRL